VSITFSIKKDQNQRTKNKSNYSSCVWRST